MEQFPIQDGGDPAFSGLVASIHAIQDDSSMTDQEKAFRRQQLMSGGRISNQVYKMIIDEDETDLVDGSGNSLSCSICMEVLDRPVTTQCSHSFCLECLKKWISQGKQTCVYCRSKISKKMAETPPINFDIVVAIRAAKMAKSNRHIDQNGTVHCVDNNDLSNTRGRIFVSIPQDHFGPILSESDGERGRGVLVGDYYKDRRECRQWGVHFPQLRRIAGQQKQGAQSVVLSGGCEADDDHGEWFLYTGSGGRDIQSDQKFESCNEALRLSCKKGYPIRVIRSHREKRSSYAPAQKGLRYDGIYRIEKCWQKIGREGFTVCRYLFVRCDNAPAPWATDDHGGRVRNLPVIYELGVAFNVTERTESPSWDYDEEEGCWKWKRPPPASKLLWKVQKASPKERILKDDESERINKRHELDDAEGNEEANDVVVR